ncbi:unnamed protein product [Gongylonema pulchrum]|uniref:Secreted protein n=1 Tax=Gongylonema pulchrum TaxID=637853 RepID=A0A183EA51_9BILA|nr:unnamed protein product [Gongylonema pulchrum]
MSGTSADNVWICFFAEKPNRLLRQMGDDCLADGRARPRNETRDAQCARTVLGRRANTILQERQQNVMRNVNRPDKSLL